MHFTVNPNYSLLGVIGDVHGATNWTVSAIDEFAKLGITHILQLGDFGVGSDRSKKDFLKNVNDRLEFHSMLMIITLGNHENYDMLEQSLQPAKYDNSFQQLPEYDSLLFPSRGQHWNWGNVEYCSVGGANSINKSQLTPHVNWWPQESITLGDLYRANQSGSADIMLTHDCPEGVPVLSLLDPYDGDDKWSPQSLSYAKESRLMLRQIVDTVQPELLLHGHYHVNADFEVKFKSSSTGSVYQMRSVGLHMQHHRGNLALLNPQYRQIETFDPWPRK